MLYGNLYIHQWDASHCAFFQFIQFEKKSCAFDIVRLHFVFLGSRLRNELLLKNFNCLYFVCYVFSTIYEEIREKNFDNQAIIKRTVQLKKIIRARNWKFMIFLIEIDGYLKKTEEKRGKNGWVSFCLIKGVAVPQERKLSLVRSPNFYKMKNE
mgnify:CR=1 FL=1